MKRETNEPTVEELQKRREARKLEQQNNPHYLKESFKNSTSYHNSTNFYEDFENIPVTELDIPVSLKISNYSNSSKYHNMSVDNNYKRHKKHGKKKKSKKSKYTHIYIYFFFSKYKRYATVCFINYYKLRSKYIVLSFFFVFFNFFTR